MFENKKFFYKKKYVICSFGKQLEVINYDIVYVMDSVSFAEKKNLAKSLYYCKTNIKLVLLISFILHSLIIYNNAINNYLIKNL